MGGRVVEVELGVTAEEIDTYDIGGVIHIYKMVEERICTQSVWALVGFQKIHMVFFFFSIERGQNKRTHKKKHLKF